MDIISALVKQQNEWLIREIAKELQLNEESLLKKYHTPSFYTIGIAKQRVQKTTKSDTSKSE